MRIRLAQTSPLVDKSTDQLAEYSVTYPSVGLDHEGPSPELLSPFRSAAYRIIDRMELESNVGAPHSSIGHSRSDIWRRLRSLVSEVNPEGVAWLADMIMGVVNAEWEDKLGMQVLHLHHGILVEFSQPCSVFVPWNYR